MSHFKLKDLFMLSGNFCPWTKWRKYFYDSNSWFADFRRLNMSWRLAKDHDLPEFWPYGRLKSPKIENETSKNIVLWSFRPWIKITGGWHEQDYRTQLGPRTLNDPLWFIAYSKVSMSTTWYILGALQNPLSMPSKSSHVLHTSMQSKDAFQYL